MALLEEVFHWDVGFEFLMFFPLHKLPWSQCLLVATE